MCSARLKRESLLQQILYRFSNPKETGSHFLMNFPSLLITYYTTWLQMFFVCFFKVGSFQASYAVICGIIFCCVATVSSQGILVKPDMHKKQKGKYKKCPMPTHRHIENNHIKQQFLILFWDRIQTCSCFLWISCQ